MLSLWDTDIASLLSGHFVGQLRIIFRIVPRKGHTRPASLGPDQFLSYIQRFDIVPQLNPRISPTQKGPYPDPVTGLHVLKRSRRADTTIIGDIVPLKQLRELVDLTPVNAA